MANAVFRVLYGQGDYSLPRRSVHIADDSAFDEPILAGTITFIVSF